MWTYLDIYYYIIDCIFTDTYEMRHLCTCLSITCNLSYNISLDYIERGEF